MDKAFIGTIQLIEELSMNAWPSLQTLLYDGWVLRFAGGYTKRANSVNPLHPSALDQPSKIRHCAELYAAQGLPTIYKITEHPDLVPLDAALSALGYHIDGRTSVRTLSLTPPPGISATAVPMTVVPAPAVSTTAAPAPASPGDGTNPPVVEISTSFSDEWMDGFIDCSRIAEPVRPTLRAMLQSLLLPCLVACIRDGERIVACAFGVIEREHIGLFDVVVREEFRGRGYGRAVVEAVLERARSLKIPTAYLMVVNGNDPAENLYRSLGFQEKYAYWYRIKA